MHTVRLLITVAVISAATGSYGGAVVIHDERVTEVAQTLADPTDLWINPNELPRVNGFVLKPEGACIDDICVPVRQSDNSDIFITRDGKRWFNVAELADRVQQPYVVDYDTNVWSFGAIPAQRSAFVDRAVAPDFELPDVDGKRHRLSDFKGKKIMLLSWASW